MSALEKGLLWVLLYLMGYHQLDWPWIFIVLGAWFSARFVMGSDPNAEAEVSAFKAGRTSGLPGWVLHPDMHRIEWINIMIGQLWPYLDGCLKLILKSMEEDANLQERLAGYHIRAIRSVYVQSTLDLVKNLDLVNTFCTTEF